MYDYYEDEDQFVFILEYIPGKNLFTFLCENGKMREKDAEYVPRQLVEGIEYLHKQNIIHRDLKPENVVINQDTLNVKLVDFGFSNLCVNELSHTFCGSLYYAAPEILQNKPYEGIKSDVWSLGVIFFAVLTNCIPWRTETKKMVYEGILNAFYDIPSYISARNHSLIRWMLQPDPDMRPSSTEIKRKLDELSTRMKLKSFAPIVRPRLKTFSSALTIKQMENITARIPFRRRVSGYDSISHSYSGQ